VPAFNLYNHDWPILTHIPSNPPAKFVHDDDDRVGKAIDSIVSNGVIVSGAAVRESVLSPGVHLHSWAAVDRSVLMDGVDVGRRAVVRNAILDKNVRVAPGVEIGVNKDDDRARGFAVSEEGVTVVGKGVEINK
jgi:glucose-1-phosphate adenylyltransferase